MNRQVYLDDDTYSVILQVAAYRNVLGEKTDRNRPVSASSVLREIVMAGIPAMKEEIAAKRGEVGAIV